MMSCRSKIWLVVSPLVLLSAGQAKGNIVISLSAFDVSMNPVSGPVATGSQITIDVFLSVTDEDNPLNDLRSLGFDLNGTSDSIVPISFTWFLDENGYGFQVASLPTPSAASVLFASGPGLVDLNEAPTRVGSLTVQVVGDGQLTLLGPSDGSPSNTGFTADFQNPVEFTAALGNIDGGTLSFSVAIPDPGPGPGPGPGPEPVEGDQDLDGVPDAEDAFPNNPTESVDSDGDGVGDHVDLDDDGDGVPDTEDAFPLDPAESMDSDSDGVGNNSDAFPDDSDEQVDSNTNGVGDNADPDDDGDGVVDGMDAFPDDPTEQGDSDGDGVGDNEQSGNNVAMGPQVRGGICGFGMIPASVLILFGLTNMRRSSILSGSRGTRR